jgi:enterochelin esterase-like enzyme
VTSVFRTIEIGKLSCTGGTLKEVTVKSAHLNARSDCSVYVPEQASTPQTVPVVILLHGVYGSHWVWNLKGKAYRTLQSLIDDSVIPPMILATPSDGLWGDGSGYLKHNGQDFERWITEDVPHLVHEATGNGHHAPLYIAGLSMGGYGALRLGAKHPSLFRAFAGHSSITAFEELSQHFVEESPEAYAQLETRPLSVIETILKNSDQIRPFRLDCGKEDPLIEGNRLLHQQLKEANIPHDYEEFPGGHDWPYWEKHIRTTFRFFGHHSTT